ncbi:MAG: hypothetical protein OEY52_10060 [Gammaproteobacteria bacterium]|nr:hypothetical protein [Gammaproteobacteria bacterium]
MSSEPSKTGGIYSVGKLISEARQLAAEYRRTTGQVLGISGEIARHDACHFLKLETVKEGVSGYDAVGRENRDGLKYQIKGRVIFDEGKKNQRIGQLKIEQDWDAILLVIMDENYETDCIYEAERGEVLDALKEQTDSNRNKRGAMSVSKFKNIARVVWTRDEGAIADEIWDNQSSQ